MGTVGLDVFEYVCERGCKLIPLSVENVEYPEFLMALFKINFVEQPGSGMDDEM